MSLTTELETNFDYFSNSWKAELPRVIASLDANRNDFLQSYSRLASLNAWRSNVLETQISTESLEFFAEALNDALISHVCARLGSWRTSLMSLRSCIENTCYCIYYKDHPIELRQWESGQHRPAFSEIHSYFQRHPDISSFGNSPVTGLALIKKEYGTLSRAVHASAKSFRMAPADGKPVLWKANLVSLAQWKSREEQTLLGLNLLLTALFRNALQGAQQQALRRALASVIPPSYRLRTKRELNVRILTG